MQKIKFIIVGSWNTIVGYSLYYLFYTLIEGVLSEKYQAYMLSIVFSQFLAIIHSFLLYKYITFKSKKTGRRIFNEFVKFLSAYTGTFLLSVILMPLITEVFLMDPRVSAIIVMAITAVGSYLLNSKYVFS